MPKTRRERCPQCGFLDGIKWGNQSGYQRYKCKNCGTIFTFRRKDVIKRNRFVWFDVKSNFFFSTFKKFSFQPISAACIQHKVGHFCYSL